MFFKALILAAALECGWVSGNMYNYTAWNETQMGALYSTLEARASSGIFYVGGVIDSYFTPRDWTHYSPFQMTYVFNAGFEAGNVKIGYEHSCFHPMQPYATIIGNEIKPKYEGGYDKLFVRIATE